MLGEGLVGDMGTYGSVVSVIGSLVIVVIIVMVLSTLIASLVVVTAEPLPDCLVDSHRVLVQQVIRLT